MAAEIALVEDAEAVQAIAHPLRLRILEALRAPESAAGVARVIGSTRQKVNYHLRELERAGLVRGAGERRSGNFVEQLFEPVADAFVLSPRLAWGGEAKAALRDHVSLERLIEVGERLQSDAAGLLHAAAYEGASVASATVEAEVRLGGAEERSAFMEEYLAALGPVLRKYGAREGQPYRVVMAVYEDPAGKE